MNRHLFIGLCAGVAIAMASFVATAALHIARVPVHEPGLFLYFPRRASEAPKLRAFIDVARLRAPRA